MHQEPLTKFSGRLPSLPKTLAAIAMAGAAIVAHNLSGFFSEQTTAKLASLSLEYLGFDVTPMIFKSLFWSYVPLLVSGILLAAWSFIFPTRKSPDSGNNNADLRDFVSIQFTSVGTSNDENWAPRLMLTLTQPPQYPHAPFVSDWPPPQNISPVPKRLNDASICITRVSVWEYEKYPDRKLWFYSWLLKNRKLAATTGARRFDIERGIFVPILFANNLVNPGFLWVCKGFSQRRMEYVRYCFSRIIWQPNWDAVIFEVTVSAHIARSVSHKFEVAYSYEKHSWYWRRG